jgi:hypothetical protein
MPQELNPLLAPERRQEAAQQAMKTLLRELVGW